MATIASIDTAVRANTENFERGMKRASKSAKTFSQQIKDIGKTASLLRGGAVLAGITGFAQFLDRVSGKFAELTDQFRHGEIGVGGFVKGIAESIPIIGSLVRTFDNVKEAITGTKAELERLNKEFSELEALAKLLEKSRESSSTTGSSFQSLLGSIFSDAALLRFSEIDRPFVELENELTKRSDDLRAAGKKAIDAIGEPFGEDAKAVQRQVEIGLRGISAIIASQREEMTKKLIELGKFGPLAPGMTPEAAKAQADQDKAIEQGIQKSVELQDSLNEAAKQAAKSIEELVKSPMQKLAEEIERINDLSSRGFLGGEIARQRITQLTEQFASEQAKTKPPKPFESPLFATTATFGSRASFEARRRAILGDRENEDIKLSKSQLEELRIISKALRAIESRDVSLAGANL